MTAAFAIRAATSEDIPQIMAFIRELALYEREPDAVTATEQDLHTALFSPNPRVFALICEDDGRAVGFALYFFNFSTWLGRHGIYLEDLYVSPADRGRGAGKALLSRIAQIAVSEGCGRFEWSVLDWNQPAIDFYESVGATPQSEWTVYRLTGAALMALAGEE